MKKIFIIPVLLVYILGLVYLSLPAPKVPQLPDAAISDEPGDTWQNPNQTAYFTNWERKQVLPSLQEDFSLKLFGLTIPSYRLNYRPEEADKYIRKHIDSYYLEEVVHPLRESLFVHGWNPRKSPRYAHLSEGDISERLIIFKDKVYRSKIILNPYYSSFLIRVLIWTAIFPASYFAFKQLFISSKTFVSSINSYLKQ